MKNSEKPINPINRLDETMRYGLGLTKREYFAAMAMQGELASYAGLNQSPNPENIAQRSIAYADELLKQLEE